MTEYLPEETFQTARQVFGDVMYNVESRTYKALRKRIEFALRVWDSKFGPLTSEQERYADEVMASVLRKARTEAGGDRAKLWPYAQAGLGRCVHHDRVVAGMRKRAGYVDPSAILEALAS